MSIFQQRSNAAEAKTRLHAVNATRAREMKNDGMTNVAIAEQMGISESTVRRLLQDTEEN